MPSQRPEWPGFVTQPCADCRCPGDHHQPVCVGHVERRGRSDFCGCPAYRTDTAQQVGLFDTHPRQEVTA